MSSKRPLKRAPWGMVGMLGLVLLVESFIARNETSFRNPWGWDWFLTDKAARRQVKDCDVLCFGDSLMKFGVAPRVIEQRADLKTYNLAVSAGQVPGSYFLLRRALESGAKPRAVILDTIPHLLAEGLGSNAMIWPELVSMRDCLELSLRARDADFFAATSLAKLLPSVRDRAEIRTSILAAFRGEPPPIKGGIGTCIRNWKVNRGAQVMAHNANRPPGDVEGFGSALFPDSWRANPLNTHYLREFFRLAESHNIQVYWLLPPLGEEVQRRREAKGRDAEYGAFVDAVRSKHPRVIVLDARRAGYGDAVHIDPIHLDSLGASSLSRDLATILRREPDGLTSWIELPKYREPPSNVPVEDLERTAAIILERRARK